MSVFHAISDPTRRAILDLLCDGDRSVNDMLETVSQGESRMTQSAFSQQLAVLRRAGLVESESQGNVRRYRITPAPLYEVVDWMAHYDRFWEAKLDRLDDYIAKKVGDKKKKTIRKESRKEQK